MSPWKKSYETLGEVQHWLSINLFLPFVHFLSPLKTSENLQGDQNGTLGRKGSNEHG